MITTHRTEHPFKPGTFIHTLSGLSITELSSTTKEDGNTFIWLSNFRNNGWDVSHQFKLREWARFDRGSSATYFLLEDDIPYDTF